MLSPRLNRIARWIALSSAVVWCTIASHAQTVTGASGTFTWADIYAPQSPLVAPDGSVTLTISGTYLIPNPASGSSITNDIIIGGNLTLDRQVTGTGLNSAGFTKSVSTLGGITVTATEFTRFDATHGGSLGGTLTLDGAGVFDLFNASGSAGITKNGSSSLNLSSNTFSGNVVLNAGIAYPLDATALGTGTVFLNGAMLDNSAAMAMTLANNLSLGGNTTIQPRGVTFTLSGALNLGATTHTLTTEAINQGGGNLLRGTVALTGVVSGSAGLTKAGDSKLSLSGANAFSGPTAVQLGVLEFNSIANVGAASSALGAPANATDGTIALGSSTNLAGTLRYTGGGSTSDRVITTTGGGGILDASGTGALVLTGGVSGNSLTLTGTSTTANSVQGVIADGASPMSVVKNGAGTWLLTNANTFTGNTTITDGTLRLTNAGALSSTGITVNGSGTLELASDSGMTISNSVNLSGGTISSDRTTGGAGSTNHVGGTANFLGDLTVARGANVTSGTAGLAFDGTLNTSNNNATISVNSGASLALTDIHSSSGNILRLSGTGDSSITGSVFAVTVIKSGAGTLSVAGTSTSNSSAYNVNGGVLNFGGSTNSTITVNSGGVLKGSGTIAGVVVNNGGIVSPGNSPGTLSAGSAYFEPGGTYVWEINNAAGSAGTNWDFMSISGQLNVDATSGSPFTIALTSLTAGNTVGPVINFNASVNSTYTIATASGGIVGFDTSKFTLSTSGFANNLAGGSWSLGTSGNNLNLLFTASAIPEPATYAAFFGVAALGCAVRRRRSA